MRLTEAKKHYQEQSEFYSNNEVTELPERIPTYIACGEHGDVARPAKTIGELPGTNLRMFALKAAAKALDLEFIHFGIPIFKTLGLTTSEAEKDGRSWLLSNGDNLKLDLFWPPAKPLFELAEIATHYPTPVGDMPIRDAVRIELTKVSDRELVDHIASHRHVDPEFMGEAIHRKLIWRGATSQEIYAAVKEWEQNRKVTEQT